MYQDKQFPDDGRVRSKHEDREGVNKNEVEFETEVHVCISDKLVQQDDEIQYYKYTVKLGISTKSGTKD
jgi:hypothetical protein